MRSDLVVLPEPNIDSDLGLSCGVEPFCVEHFFSQGGIKAFVVKQGHMSSMFDEITKTGSEEAVAQYTFQISASEIVNVTMVSELDYMSTKEATGVNWLHTVEHMLVMFSNGSRTDACSGTRLLDWYSVHNELQLQIKLRYYRL